MVYRRSAITDQNVINDLDKKIAVILKEEATRAGMSIKTDVISSSPVAAIPGHRNSGLVKIAEAVHRAMGLIRRSRLPVRITQLPHCCKAFPLFQPVPGPAITRMH